MTEPNFGEDYMQYMAKSWSPPWLDNGESLLRMIKKAQQVNNTISWQIGCAFLCKQIVEDLKIAQEVNYLFNPDVNDEALPYSWGVEISGMKKIDNNDFFYDWSDEELKEEYYDDDDDEFD